MPSTRLSREARREQLVAIGARLVAERSFEEVSVEDVAAAASISRGLLFHYFPTKLDFQVAVAERAAAELLEATDAPADLAPAERLLRGVETFVDHVGSRPDAYVSLVRGAASGEPALRDVSARTRAVLVDRVLEGLELVDDPPPAVLLIVRGWVAASEEMVVTWLQGGAAIPREELIDLVVGGLVEQLHAVLPTSAVARVRGTA
jgi:AcrR family transcriptional regulator